MPTDADLMRERAEALDAILNSPARLKLIVAGPGTGKTHTFQKLMDGNTERCLALTFLVSLVTELTDSLGDDHDVYSFHGFAKKLLLSMKVDGVTRSVDYYPPIDQIYAKDISITDRPTDTASISEALVKMEDDGVVLPGILRSGSYYNSVGHSDSVYRVFRALEARPSRVPRYPQIVVDEYQDFNLLEVSLIKLLATASPTLIVGDDDQALYGFKHASASFIRDLSVDPSYTRFDLPFCSRCTPVLIKAVHRVVERAQAAGLLQERITKRYECFLPEKRDEGNLYPKIVHARCTVQNNRCPFIGKYVEQRIRALPADEIAESRAGGYPTVLVIGPKEFARPTYRYLSEHLPSVEYRIGSSMTVAPLDGFRRLMRDRASRLGWRLLLELDSPPGWEEWIRDALIEGADIADLLDADYKTTKLEIVEILVRIVGGEAAGDDDLRLVEAATGLSSSALHEALGRSVDDQDEDEEASAEQLGDDAQEEPTVFVTSLLGAKGLQAGHVFVVGVTDKHFPRSNTHPTDDEVCQLIVALTRARKSCTLVSVGRFGNERLALSVFTSWLAPLLTSVRVDSSSFR